MAFAYSDILEMARVPPGKRINLRRDYDPAFLPAGWSKEAAQERLAADIRLLAEWQEKLYADDTYALLIILQALDAAGKDSTIKHVMSGVNPQGVTVTSFRAPSPEELDHDYLWRNMKALPERGRIGIFNRSYYEEVLVTRVHPGLLGKQKLPPHAVNKGIWDQRFGEINNIERYLVGNGIIVLKFFLNISKEEQKRRLLERLDLPEKNWKYSVDDISERAYWDEYIDAYDELISHTSTEWAPWYIIPADHKWVTRLAVGAIISNTLRDLKVDYPALTEERRNELILARRKLGEEDEGKDSGKSRRQQNKKA